MSGLLADANDGTLVLRNLYPDPSFTQDISTSSTIAVNATTTQVSGLITVAIATGTVITGSFTGSLAQIEEQFSTPGGIACLTIGLTSLSSLLATITLESI
ncbi:MAG: hypothetical protein WBA97_08100 [Actinophytocola sp.]|uniref:hypothetical protein n=1 Tax=Actinophytocola sp. TaxID=1872138 RepID=UPI003C7345C4